MQLIQKCLHLCVDSLGKTRFSSFTSEAFNRFVIHLVQSVFNDPFITQL